jgi:2-polyprenyl-6-methoxyphenol hydroxylase-like FAD-dependent oxidoreductase
MRVFGDAGGEVNFAAEQSAQAGHQALTWIVDVPTLEATLANALQFAPNVTLLDAPQPATLTVVCEGKNSNTRAEFGVEFDSTPYGQSAIAARLTCEQSHQNQAFQWFSGGEILGLLPLSDSPQGNSVALVWSVSDEHAPSLCALPPEEFAKSLQAFCVLPGQLPGADFALGAMTLSSDRVCWPLVQAVARRWTGQVIGHPQRNSSGLSFADGLAHSWVLAGDAAHAVHPLAGQGLNLGLGDVAELAHILGLRATTEYWRSVGDPKLLRRYERARRAALAPVGTVMDGLQRLFALNEPTVQRLRNLGMKGFDRSGLIKTWVANQAMGK